MSHPSALCIAFLRGWGRTDTTDTATLEELLQRAREEGRGAWPAVELSDEAFGHYLGERSTHGARSLRAKHFSDLWLACGCALGLDSARSLLDAHVLGSLSPVIRRVHD